MGMGRDGDRGRKLDPQNKHKETKEGRWRKTWKRGKKELRESTWRKAL